MMAAGSTTTAASNSRPFTTPTGTSVTWASRPVRPGSPNSTPARVRPAATSAVVDDDVAVGPHLLGVLARRRAPAQRTEQGPGLVQQGDVGVGPLHVVHRGAAATVQQGDLLGTEHVPTGQGQQGPGAEQVVEQL